LQPPPELVPFGNGKVPAHTLAPLGEGNHRLWAPAAKAFREMRAAAARDNVSFDLTDSYRDLATQHDLVARKGLYSKGGLAAAPGTSNHGWGMAVDLDLDPRAQAWMRDNGWRFGFVEDTPREPWHWGFRPQGGTTSVSAWR
jgi:LAS superfamily LD-carboxypeptidase LdcB